MKAFSLYQHLVSARLVVTDLLDDQYDNDPEILDLLDYVDEDEQRVLPGYTVEDFMDRWTLVLHFASEPVPMPTKGRDKVFKMLQQEYARKRIMVVAIECIALLETTTTK